MRDVMQAVRRDVLASPSATMGSLMVAGRAYAWERVALGHRVNVYSFGILRCTVWV